jgi:cell division protein FtsL
VSEPATATRVAPRVVASAQRRGLGLPAFLLALATVGALAHVGVRMKGLEVAYDLGREKRINTQLEDERRSLNIEIEMLKDPVRIVAIARDKLKMGPAAATDIVRLSPGAILAEQAPPPERGKHAGAKAAAARPGAAAAAAHPTATVEPRAAPARSPEEAR